MRSLIVDEVLHVVTGAFGYTGRSIAHRLLEKGIRVRTLTNAIGRDDPFDGGVEVHSLDFNDHTALVESLRGAEVLYNTYWVRYNHPRRNFDHGIAVENSRRLFAAAAEAGVERIVHLSVAHPHKAPDWTYFRGKVAVEELLHASNHSYAILRPTVLFGGGRNVLVNNIAWMLRKFPVFGVFGMGNYSIQPVHIKDVARVAVEQGEARENVTLDVTGPETFRYKEYIGLMAKSMGLRRLILPVPSIAGWLFGKFLGIFLQDLVITRAEIRGLKRGLMASDEEPLGVHRFSEWIAEHGSEFGKSYQNDLKEREYRSPSAG
ncbi:MAG: epimerase [Roseibacillus sp.]|jgi:NADH dehydrogenase|nr:epimerase [Roseibacillus sp.]MBP35009.1 epimerase [Roseibacillus sp.]MCP4731872.1 NAD(P)H-binding protein [Roseibacillus sp.]MDP7309407.1 NAD(P)H-binding protein [Roseibacillus sp.]HJM64848.1 NAD(P)H-binding protein [Roseibacillus sp.]|tara:strand:- start:1021 stop:1977 length:957 start_codon:yes stop_codon:yes gene_type:complete